MADIDGAHALKSSSEESYQFECSPCENDGITKQAKFFCLQCKEYLCQSCERSHKRFRGTRNHRVLSGEMIPENVDEPQLTDINSMRCPCARNELEMYCTNHNEVFCSDCKVIKHRHCETNLVDEMFKEATEDVDDVTSSRANEVKEKLMTLKYNRKQDLEKLATERENCKEKIASFRKELNWLLDEIEENATESLDEATETHREIVKQHLATCSVALQTLSFDMDNYERAKSSRDVRQRYLTTHKLQQTCQDLDNVLDDLNKELYEPNVVVETNKALKSLLTIDCFCTLNHNLRGGSKNFTSELETISSRKENVRFASDQNLPWISGSSFLPNGEIVLCDRNNNCLKVLELAFGKKDNHDPVKLSGKPRDCCLINEHEVLVTLPGKKQVQWFQIRPSIKVKKSFDFDKECEGVAAMKNEIFVTYHENPDKGIKVMNQDGTTNRIIVLNESSETIFKVPFYITVGSSYDIYVSETDSAGCESQIRCFAKDGTCKYKVVDQNLKSALGVFAGSYDCLLVCCWKNNKVLLLSKDGTGISDFLTSDDKISQPYSISFRESDATLLVTMRDSDEMLVCKMK